MGKCAICQVEADRRARCALSGFYYQLDLDKSNGLTHLAWCPFCEVPLVFTAYDHDFSMTQGIGLSTTSARLRGSVAGRHVRSIAPLCQVQAVRLRCGVDQSSLISTACRCSTCIAALISDRLAGDGGHARLTGRMTA